MTTTKQLESLAKRAERAMDKIYSMGWDAHTDHGMEYVRDFFVLYNREAGQSRTVLYHPKSGYVFKPHAWTEPDDNSSRKVLGTVDLDGKEYIVRLPEFHVFGDVQVAEYVPCVTCCETQKGWCHHTKALSGIAGGDAHAGNYRISGNEIIMIDFEYME